MAYRVQARHPLRQGVAADTVEDGVMHHLPLHLGIAHLDGDTEKTARRARIRGADRIDFVHGGRHGHD